MTDDLGERQFYDGTRRGQNVVSRATVHLRESRASANVKVNELCRRLSQRIATLERAVRPDGYRAGSRWTMEPDQELCWSTANGWVSYVRVPLLNM